MPHGLDDSQQAAWERDAAFLAQLQDSSAVVITCRRASRALQQQPFVALVLVESSVYPSSPAS
jgi:hypothetical protein